MRPDWLGIAILQDGSGDGPMGGGDFAGELRERAPGLSGLGIRGEDRSALEFCGDGVGVGGAVPLDLEDVWFAADLAVFDVGLAKAGGFVDGGVVPLAAACALEGGFVGHGFYISTRAKLPGLAASIARSMAGICCLTTVQWLVERTMRARFLPRRFCW